MSAAVAAARPSQALRQRRESQRPGVARVSTRVHTVDMSAPKEDAKRYVYTQQDMLAKWKGYPPSLTVQLHQNHFRLNGSPDTLNYAGPMKELLQHIRDKTVPHNMVDVLYENGTPFYDDCLIVEVRDFRVGGIKPKDDPNSTAAGDVDTPFSIHNYNNFITPSPHVPFPESKPSAKPGQVNGQAKGGDAKDDKELDKENMPAPGPPASQQKQPVRQKVTTVVLFPTTQSHYTDIQLLATTPAPDVATYRRNQAAGRAAGNPPTPLTAIPPTPTFPSGRSPKRQKMVLDDSNVHEFEAAVLNARCPKLYLEPTKSLAESVALIEAMSHPNNQNPAPPRKTRKRTTAELAADEAEAAEMQRYMLAGDEQQASKTAAASGADEAQHAARAGANSQTFSRFKTLATIKMNHEEADRRKKEEEARLAQAKRQAQIEAETQKRREMEANRQAEQSAALTQQRQELMRQQLQQQAAQQEQALRAATQAQQMQNAAAHASQTPHSATQPQFSSPVVRQQTPMASMASPLVATHASHPMGGTPMVATSSNHGAGSPARPPSAVSHNPNAMVRSASQQHNLSRTGTPQMVQGTPVMNSAMPARNMASTPTPRMNNQGSPSVQMQGSTPIMIQTPQPGPSMTPEQMQQLAAQQHNMQQIRLRQHIQQQQNMSPGPPNPQQAQQLAVHRAKLHVQTHGVPQGQDPRGYQNMLAQKFYQNILQQNQQAQVANASPQGLQQASMPNPGGLNLANMNLQQLRATYMNRKQTLFSTYGQNIPQQAMNQMRQLEIAIAQREQQQQQLAQGGQMHMNQGMQNQMAMQGGNPQNPVQMQQYQQMLQQQRAQQQRAQQMMQMRQQAMAQGGQMPQNMMNNMQGMNMANMGNMGMNMNFQGMNMGNMAGMQGMQGMNMGGQMNQQQQQQQQQQMQQMMMRQAQQQAAARMAGQQGGEGVNWSGV